MLSSERKERLDRAFREIRARRRARRPLIAIDFGGSVSIGRWDFLANFSTRRPIKFYAHFEWECEQACWTVGGLWFELSATRDDAGQPLA